MCVNPRDAAATGPHGHFSEEKAQAHGYCVYQISGLDSLSFGQGSGTNKQTDGRIDIQANMGISTAFCAPNVG